MNDEQLSNLVRGHATRHRASDRLRGAVHTQIALQAASRGDGAAADPATAPRAGPPPPQMASPTSRRGWRSALAGFAGGCIVALGLTLVVLPGLQDRDLPHELVADHVRALRVGPLIEVASSDRHTVKPWYQGRLDYAPTVHDLAGDGFVLLGGRLEHIEGAPAAALAYQRHKHLVTVFVWPVTRSRAPQAGQVRGFNVLRWADGAMQVWAVSDAEPAELARLKQAWVDHSAGR